MAKSRKETWLAIGVVAVAFIPAAIAGLWLFMSMTAPTLHPDAQQVPSSAGPPAREEWTTAVTQGRQVARSAIAEQNLPGLSVAVGVDGEIVWAEGFGWATIEGHEPVAPTTRFRIGSASIPLTSAAVGLLLEDGRLKLDESIQTSVPEFPVKQTPVTLRQLMSHLAGLPNDGGDEGPLYGQHCERAADAFQHLNGYERELRFAPGTAYRFSLYGWVAASAAIEAAADEALLRFIRARIFEPLEMHETAADSVSEPLPMATPYFPRFAADPRYGLHLMRPLDYSCYAGAGMFLSTPSDLVRFAMAINGGHLLKPATVQLLQTSQRLPTGEETGYGLGWDRETVTLAGRDSVAIGHDGMVLGGPAAALITIPERGLAVAVLSNISYSDTPAISLRIAQAFAEQGGRPADQ